MWLSHRIRKSIYVVYGKIHDSPFSEEEEEEEGDERGNEQIHEDVGTGSDDDESFIASSRLFGYSDSKNSKLVDISRRSSVDSMQFSESRRNSFNPLINSVVKRNKSIGSHSIRSDETSIKGTNDLKLSDGSNDPSKTSGEAVAIHTKQLENTRENHFEYKNVGDGIISTIIMEDDIEIAVNDNTSGNDITVKTDDIVITAPIVLEPFVGIAIDKPESSKDINGKDFYEDKSLMIAPIIMGPSIEITIDNHEPKASIDITVDTFESDLKPADRIDKDKRRPSMFSKLMSHDNTQRNHNSGGLLVPGSVVSSGLKAPGGSEVRRGSFLSFGLKPSGGNEVRRGSFLSSGLKPQGGNEVRRGSFLSSGLKPQGGDDLRRGSFMALSNWLFDEDRISPDILASGERSMLNPNPVGEARRPSFVPQFLFAEKSNQNLNRSGQNSNANLSKQNGFVSSFINLFSGPTEPTPPPDEVSTPKSEQEKLNGIVTLQEPNSIIIPVPIPPTSSSTGNLIFHIFKFVYK
jgi:hypothetical protein